MAGVAFGGAALGGGFALAAAGYQTSAGFAARHEITHAQQIEATKRYITEFEDSYKRDEVSEEDWKQYLSIRDEARESEKLYEDSINAYKEESTFKFIRKWKLRTQVRNNKKKLRQSNRSLRSHYDTCSSGASDASSVSAEHGSPPRSQSTYSEEDDEQISNWAKDVAASIFVEKRWKPDPRCLHVITGPKNCFASLSFSPDGKRVVSGSLDNNIRIWDVQEEKLYLGPLEGHKSWVLSVSYSANGERIVSGSADGTLRIWEAQTGVCTVGPFGRHTKPIKSVAFSPDGQLVVSGSSDTTIQMWDAWTGLSIAGPLRGHSHFVQSVAFSPDSKHVVSTSLDCTIRVWDARAGIMVVGPLKYRANIPFVSAVFSPDGEHLISVSKDGVMNLWNAKTGTIMKPPSNPIASSPTCAAFSPDGIFAVSGSIDCTLTISDILTGEIPTGLLKGHTRMVESVAFSADGRRVASGSPDCSMRIWDVEACFSSKVYS